MRWQQGRKSSNIEDRRGQGVRKGAKVGGFAIVAALAALVLTGNVGPLIGLIGGNLMNTRPQQQTNALPDEQEKTAEEFVSVILGTTEDVWIPLFQQKGGQYTPPKLVLYNDMVESACGVSSAQSGPFYCPGDSQVYLDLSFLNELQRLGAKGDFAVAYVIAHEIGHHVQNLTGIADQVRQAQMRTSKANANALSVLTELQADCYAGVWANHAHQQHNILEQGDIEEGLNAAASIGDDRLQKMAGQRIHPDSFTHGTSEQRMQWLQKGIKSGDFDQCDTFVQIN